ncbi:MAG: CRISPR-associated helicase Cas3' [Ruminococcus sp.]|nr:CRISPR-associated helicase Cas3' [Ruminococcus sp.]
MQRDNRRRPFGQKELHRDIRLFYTVSFSCLTDADYLDTEKFCSLNTDRKLTADFERIRNAVDEKLRSFEHNTNLQSARSRLQQQAFINAKEPADISILNIPTGSGKTLCSLKIALDKVLASKGEKKRIIYVIPYTSIIEQTAELFGSIFGEYADILQHHSNYSFDDENEPTTAEKLKRAAENWDAPFIVTTCVRFFESLYHYKSSSLRKLHNMANAVIIFDEIHLLPLDHLQPCLKGIGHIVKYLGSEAVFLSATMPDYSGLFKRYLPDCSYSVLVRDKADFRHFKKCRYIYIGKTEPESLLEKAQMYSICLIVVNTRKRARELYRRLSGNKYHLSTYMTPDDRSKTIAAVRSDIENGLPVTVVSTSLIEAGADLDFKAVFRETAGLDNIIQAGGRCNREGKDDMGNVYVFETEEGLPRDIQPLGDIVKSLFKEFEDISSEECIKEYYRRLHGINNEKIERDSIDDGRINIDSVPFRTYAREFSFIKDDSVGVVIRSSDRARELYEELKAGNFSVRRNLQKYTVPLKRYELEKAVKLGLADDFGTGVLTLTNENYYSTETGFDIDFADDKII